MPFPSKEGDISEINQVVPLQFPGEAETGDYNIVGEIIEAKVEFGLFPLDVTEYFPQSQQIGSVKYIGLGALPAPESPSVPTPTPAPAPAPTKESTTTPPPELKTTPLPAPASVPTPLDNGVTWWVWIIVAAAIATTLFNIVWYLRNRTRY